MFVRLPKPETPVVVSGKDFGAVESMKWVERLKSPLTGSVKEVNAQLRNGLVNKNPYGSGWMIKIQPAGNVDTELSKLIHGKALLDCLKKEIDEEVKKSKKTKLFELGNVTFQHSFFSNENIHSFCDRTWTTQRVPSHIFPSTSDLS